MPFPITELIIVVREFMDMIKAGRIALDASEADTPHAVELADGIETLLAGLPLTQSDQPEHPEHLRLKAFAKSFLNPEELGFSVSAAIRDEARISLGIPPCETPPRR
jgi:hypothetical protein